MRYHFFRNFAPPSSVEQVGMEAPACFATTIMQYLVLLAVVSMMALYVLIIAGCLCYIGRHGRRTP
jgi:hypothetical protein